MKSSTIYIRDNAGSVVGILGINYDITNFAMMERTLKRFLKRERK